MDLTIAQMTSNEKEMARKQLEIQMNHERVQKAANRVMKDRAEDADLVDQTVPLDADN